MDSRELERLLKKTSNEFLSMPDEVHREIRNNPHYDGLFHIISDMTSFDTEAYQSDAIICSLENWPFNYMQLGQYSIIKLSQNIKFSTNLHYIHLPNNLSLFTKYYELKNENTDIKVGHMGESNLQLYSSIQLDISTNQSQDYDFACAA